MKKLRVDVWSDVACPWCWVGKRHLEAAIAKFEHPVTVTWRAFELDPNAPPSPDEAVDYAERIARKYGTPRDQAQQMIDRIVETGAQSDIPFRFDRIKPGNTFDAHRLLHAAETESVQNELKERLFDAYLHRGEAISQKEVLLQVAEDAGLDRESARAVLESDAHANEVRAEENRAHQIGVGGVPFFVLDNRYALSGAQPAELILEAMQKAWDDPPADATENA